LKISQQESWRIFNLQSWIEDSPRRVLEEMPEDEEMPQAEVTEQSPAAERK